MIPKLNAITYSALALAPVICTAASSPDGKLIVRIPDGTNTRCINATTDRITMNVRRMIVKKDVGVFSQDKSAGIIINTTISGEEAGATPRTITFPRMYSASVASYAEGYVSIPIEQRLFSRFELNNAGNKYDDAEIEFSVIAKRDKTAYGSALTALAEISRNLPTPANPFSEGFKYFTDYANKAVESTLSKENQGAQFKEGKIALSFSRTNVCTGDQERTGTLAVINSVPETKSGFIDITKNYCWRAKLRPVFTLSFAPEKSGQPCDALSDTAFRNLNNPHIAFYLNAEPKDLSTSSQPQIYNFDLTNERIAALSFGKNDVKAAVLKAYQSSSGTNQSPKQSAIDLLTDSVTIALTHPNFTTKGDPDPASDWEEYVEHHKNQKLQVYSVTKALSIDLAESLKRCKAHGIDIEACF